MSISPSPEVSAGVPANDNKPAIGAMPTVLLLTFADLLAEVCVARLAAANHNHSPATDTTEGAL